MDEHHTFVKTMIEFGNLWGGPFFELQMAFFDKESSHKLVSLGYPFFLNPESKTIEILFFLQVRAGIPFSAFFNVTSCQNPKPCQFGKPTPKNVQTAVVLHKFSIWKYHYSYGICFAPCLCTPKFYSKHFYPQYS